MGQLMLDFEFSYQFWDQYLPYSNVLFAWNSELPPCELTFLERDFVFDYCSAS